MISNVRFAVAVHVLALLAQEPEPCTSAYIAGSVRTHPVVIRRLLRSLGAAGFVTGRVGPAGGFRLSRPPADIRLDAVFRAVEEAGTAPRAHRPNPACPVGRHVRGVVEGIGERAERAFLASLAEQSIADVAREVRRKARGGRAATPVGFHDL